MAFIFVFKKGKLTKDEYKLLKFSNLKIGMITKRVVCPHPNLILFIQNNSHVTLKILNEWDRYPSHLVLLIFENFLIILKYIFFINN